MKINCCACGKNKDVKEFYKGQLVKDPLERSCKNCVAKRSRSHTLYSKYGMTVEDYATMLLQQNCKCAICGATEGTKNGRKLFVDHNHKTGKVRKLLCHNCNVAIGLAKENIDILTSMISYLREHEE